MEKEEIAFGIVMQQLRNGKGLSQEDFAHRCGIDRTYVSSIERGKKSPTFRMIVKICRCLDVSLPKFFTAIERQAKYAPATGSSTTSFRREAKRHD